MAAFFYIFYMFCPSEFGSGAPYSPNDGVKSHKYLKEFSHLPTA